MMPVCVWHAHVCDGICGHVQMIVGCMLTRGLSWGTLLGFPDPVMSWGGVNQSPALPFDTGKVSPGFLVFGDGSDATLSQLSVCSESHRSLPRPGS